MGPVLDVDEVVISDRYFDSFTAYQGGGRILATNKTAAWLDSRGTSLPNPLQVAYVEVVKTTSSTLSIFPILEIRPPRCIWT